MKSIKKFILQKLTFSDPKNLDDNNSLERFLSTLTEEEKSKNFLDFHQSHQVQYTKALFDFQIEAMGDISEAAFKALTMFAIKLHNSHTADFKFEQSFYGTKENLKEELFSIKIYPIDSVAPSKPMIEYANENSNKPRKKTESFLNQSDIVLNMIEKLNGQFPMNEKNELPLRVSCLLLVAELMSQSNMETMDITLEGLIEGDKNLNASYKVEALRKEFILNPEMYSRKKLF